jgi:hypothetical protein
MPCPETRHLQYREAIPRSAAVMALQRKYTYSAYEVIGLENGAADDHVKQRVKALRVLLHPDGHKPALAPFADDAKALLKRVVQADDALTDKLNHPRDYSLIREKEREIESLKQEIEKLKAGKFDESDIEKERKKLADENLKLRLDLEQQRNKTEELVGKYNATMEEIEKAVYAVKEQNEALFAELELSRQKVIMLERQKTSGIYAFFMGLVLLIELIAKGVMIFSRWLTKHQQTVVPWSIATGVTALALYGISILFN